MLREMTARDPETLANETDRPLTAYFRDLADAEVMTREEETAAAIFATFTYGLGLMLPAGVLKALLP